MTMTRWNGTADVALTVAERWNGSSWVPLTVAERWNGSAWVAITLPGGGGGALSATVSAESVAGSEFRSGPGQPAVLTVASDTPAQVTVTPTGGTGPYTYAWTHESGSSAVQVDAPTAATTGFTANIGKNQSRTAVKRCTVTDSLLATFHVLVTITLDYVFEP